MDAIEALEICRGRMADDKQLLIEALSAARKGKTHVVIDHLERVLVAQQHVYQVTGYTREAAFALRGPSTRSADKGRK